jgi:non-homologous end joining protein Ku
MRGQPAKRSSSPWPPASDCGSPETDLATAVIKAIAGPFAPEEFTGQHKAKLESLITSKGQRQKTLPSAAPQAAVLAPAVDIMAARRREFGDR